MTKEELLEKYKSGFTVRFDTGSEWDDILTENWTLNEEGTDKDNLRFWGYDANFCGLPLFSTRKDKCYKGVIENVLELTKGLNINVWLDDERIKEKVYEKMENK